MIRDAKFSDIPAIVDLLEEMRARSIYAKLGALDRDEAKRFLFQCIQRHGATHDGGTFVMVATTYDVIGGFIVGVLDRLYHVMVPLSGTDVFWYCNGLVEPIDAVELYDRFIAWCEANPKVVQIKPGVTDGINEERRAEVFFRRRKFRVCGTIFERIIER